MENLESNIQDLFKEVKIRAFAEGVNSVDAWAEMVDEVIEERRRNGELSDDNALEGMEDVLEAMWPAYEAELSAEVQ